MRFGRLITGHTSGSKQWSQDANGVSKTRRSNCRGYGWFAAIPPESNLSDFLLGTSVCLLGERMRSSLARAEQSEREARHTVEELAQAITIRREIEKQLRQALETAEEATRAKSTFLAYMSHEIRTPLHGILGMLELLGRSELDERQQRYTRLARSSADL
ncbi:MAG: hypothetical protein JO252_29305, partial [Planctomycetaceae bacterium]|nr:hypothetical protein [Planctomycetaceae bacterium]